MVLYTPSLIASTRDADQSRTNPRVGGTVGSNPLVGAVARCRRIPLDTHESYGERTHELGRVPAFR